MNKEESQQIYIQKIYNFLIAGEAKALILRNLKGIRIANESEFPHGSAMRTKNGVILIPENSVNNLINQIPFDMLRDELSKSLSGMNEDLRCFLTDFYHELLHIDAHEQFPTLHKQYFDSDGGVLALSIIHCWIEFYVEKQTVLSSFKGKDVFTKSFIDIDWSVKYIKLYYDSRENLLSLIKFVPYFIAKFQNKEALSCYLAQVKDGNVKVFINKLYDIFNDLYFQSFDSYDKLSEVENLMRSVFKEIFKD